MPLYLGMTSAAVIWTFDLLARRGCRRRADLPLPADQPWPRARSRARRGPPCSSGPPSARAIRRSYEKTGLAARPCAVCSSRAASPPGCSSFAIGDHPRPAAGLRVRPHGHLRHRRGHHQGAGHDPKSRLPSIIVIACFSRRRLPTMQFLHTRSPFIWSRFRCS